MRYELDDRTLAKADINLAQTTSMNAASIAARDALADLLGNLGLSYRVADDGRLFITTAARLSEEASKKGTVIEGPPVKLTMPPPMKASNPSYAEVTRHALARRMAGQGQRDDVAQTLACLSTAKASFEPGELIILVHLSRAAIDDAVVLDVFPPPKKLVRTALLVVHGVDPRLQDRARTLVQAARRPVAEGARNGRELASPKWGRSPCRPSKMHSSIKTSRSSSAPSGSC